MRARNVQVSSAILLVFSLIAPSAAVAHPGVPRVHYEQTAEVRCDNGEERLCEDNKGCFTGQECAIHNDDDGLPPGICVDERSLLLCVRDFPALCTCATCECPTRLSGPAQACYDYSDETSAFIICSYQPPETDPFCGRIPIGCVISGGAGSRDSDAILDCFADLGDRSFESGDCDDSRITNLEEPCPCADEVDTRVCFDCGIRYQPPLADAGLADVTMSDVDVLDAAIDAGSPTNPSTLRFRGGGGCALLLMRPRTGGLSR